MTSPSPGWIASGQLLLGCFLFLLCGSISAVAALEETNFAATAAVSAETNDIQKVLHAIVQLQQQAYSNQLAAQQLALDLKQAAALNAEALSNRLLKMEATLALQEQVAAARRARDVENIQSSQRLLLLVTGCFAAVAILALVIVAWVQWRMNRVWDVLLPGTSRTLLLNRPPGLPELPVDSNGSAPHPGAPLLHVLEQLESRVRGLEALARGPLPAQPGTNGRSAHAENGNELAVPDPVVARQERIATLLRQGQHLLKQGEAELALRCFNEVLFLDQTHAEALVKKGAALERLHKSDEALACYDAAIASDDAFAVAYLYKGGLCSRTERFKEALECYEKALRAHEERHA